ncbi:MAG: DUF547 domain-containing protein [Geminicoccaceae bacterium]
MQRLEVSPRFISTSRRDLLRLGGIAILTAGHSLSSTRQAHAAPAAKLWARWQAHDQSSTATIDHTSWNRFLDRYLALGADGINRVAYGRVSARYKVKLAQYIDDLVALPISTYNRPEQMAFWVNLYNALTVQIILDHYPVSSIRDIDISPGLFSDGPWGKKLVMIEGERVALDDIEHQILRPIWQDPRIHYAVNCASLGCPNLLPKPFVAVTLDQQLDQAAVDFINHKRAVSIKGRELYVSSIYSWFADDFGGHDRYIIAHLKRYASPELAEKLSGFFSIDDDQYDWRLNDADNLKSQKVG